ncbi:hypothetical protein GCM10010174_88230 [Kutzneria viridogrisea]|uniref:Uncharacterized protein n=1 Tax=Kutzneria albida DSM 43870 TaxID=1449976 RepID=W5WMF3_9PSEU|nr:hypothetical protein KALB_8345 [Kutzneria albida DSM 43870]
MRPRAVQVGIVLWAVDAALYLATAVLLIASHNTVVQEFAKQQKNTTLTPEQVLDALNAQLIVYEVVFVLLAVLAGLFAYMLRAQRRWARVAFVVLALVQLASIALAPTTPTQLGTLAGLVGLLMLFLPKSSAYFTELKQG